MTSDIDDTIFDAEEPSPEGSDSASDELAPEREMPRALSSEARAAMLALMQRGVVLHSRHGPNYQCLLKDRVAIQQVLVELDLEVVIDESRGLAQLKPLPTDEANDDHDLPSHPLLRQQTLSYYDSLMLIQLRKRYADQAKLSSQVFIDQDELEQLIEPFLNLPNSDRLISRNASGAIDRFKQRNILADVRGEKGRYEILPTIRILGDYGNFERLEQDYKRMLMGEEFMLEAQGEEEAADVD